MDVHLGDGYNRYPPHNTENVALNRASPMLRRLTLTILVSSALLTVSAECLVGREADLAGLDGTWKFEYSCAGFTAGYAARCAAGERDDFTISIAHSGQKVCGWYEATTQLGNHVDDGDLRGWTFARIGQETYHVHFNLSGTSGKATAKVQGTRMTWHVINSTKDKSFDNSVWQSFFPPHSAILIRQNSDQVQHSPSCKN